MHTKHRALTSVVAIFGLLAFVCLSSINPASAFTAEFRESSNCLSNCLKVHRSGPASATTYLSEVKPRVSAISAAIGSLVAMTAAFPPTLPPELYFTDSAFAVQSASRPLWLINRSLLI